MHFPNLREIINPANNRGEELLIWAATTLVSGLIIILSISPEYLRELNPFTLLLLSVACSLPVWALNQLLWWHIGRSVITEVVNELVTIIDISDKHRKEFSFALAQLFKLVDIMRFIPHGKIANLVTIISIYLSAAGVYLTAASPAILYAAILLICLLCWLIGLYALHRVRKNIGAQSLRDLWRQMKDDDKLLAIFSEHVKRVEESMLAGTNRN